MRSDKVIPVKFEFRLPVKVTKRRKWYLASCPMVDVHSQGDTEDKARHNLTEALSLFFISCLERKTLDRVLKDCGFAVGRLPKPVRSKRSAPSEDYVDVPIPFLVTTTHHRSCRV
jgi:predicted RNase H-like HicB family nuclease